MTQKTKRTPCYLLCILIVGLVIFCFFTSLFQGRNVYSADEILLNNRLYDELFASWEQLIAQREKNFSNLVFSLADREDQISEGTHLKFVLKDQLGRKWIFKPSIFAEDRRGTTAYYIYMLYGMYFPEIHIKTLPINGNLYKGQMIEFLEDYENMKPPDVHTEKSIQYILRKQVLDYVIANTDVGFGNFLVKKKSNEIVSITGIDLDAAFQMLYSFDDYQQEVSFYSDEFWQMLDYNKVNSLFSQLYSFINVVQMTPNSLFKEIASLHLPEQRVQATLCRKNNVRDSLCQYYGRVTDSDNILQDCSNSNIEKSLGEIITTLQKWHRNDVREGGKVALYQGYTQENIDISTSIEAWKIVFSYFVNQDIGPRQLEEMKSELNNLKASTLTQKQVMVIDKYLTMLETYDLNNENKWDQYHYIVEYDSD